MTDNNNNILIIGPSWLGDMIMAQSLMILLKAQGFQKIDLLAPQWCLEVAKNMPQVNNIIESKLAHGELNIAKRYHLGKSLRGQYSHAIVLPNSFKSALIPFFAKIPIRIGWRGEFRYGLLNDLRVLNKNNFPLMIQRYAQLGLPKDAPPIIDAPIPELITISPLSCSDKFNLNDPEAIILCPGAAGGSAKRWPKEYYLNVAENLLRQNKQIWLMGSINDKEITDFIANQLPLDSCKNLAGTLKLSETVNVISLAKALVTNDSGLMHVASALKIPVIAIFGPTSPKHTPPLGSQAVILENKIPCQPCFKKKCPLNHHRCMIDIEPIRVINEIEKVSINK